MKKERRAGRPASTREDLLKMKIAADEREYENGFCQYSHVFGRIILIQIDMPDLTSEDNVVFLDRWEGAWSYLSTLKWVTITINGEVKESKFPPKGQS